MKSTFAWLDYSDKERENALQVVRQLQSPEARDELGIGVVRDVLSDSLFPGTSTIQTRLRYFLFVPWVFQQLDKAVKQGRVDDPAVFVRDREETLLTTLLRQDDAAGVIGRVSGTSVKTMPGAIYWSGLAAWGIRHYSGSRREYYQDIAWQVRSGVTHETEQGRFNPRWDVDLPEPPSDFPQGVTMQVTPGEARYIQRLFQTQESVTGTLLSTLIQQADSIPEAMTFPWQIPDVSALPDSIQHDLWHTRNFSEAIDGATLFYNLLLAQKQQRPDLITDYTDRLQQWSNLIESREVQIRDWWQNDRFWLYLNYDIPRRTRQFIEDWMTILLEGDGLSLAKNPPDDLIDRYVGEIIKKRECDLKKTRARLTYQSALDMWGGASAVAQLDFRWPIARQYINEIADALEPADAEA